MIHVEYYHRVGLNRGQIRLEDARGSFPFDGSTFWSLESSPAQIVHRNSQKEVSGCRKELECEQVCVCVPLSTMSVCGCTDVGELGYGRDEGQVGVRACAAGWGAVGVVEKLHLQGPVFLADRDQRCGH